VKCSQKKKKRKKEKEIQLNILELGSPAVLRGQGP
jgi:hypothetical protein